jgi:FecR protein
VTMRTVRLLSALLVAMAWVPAGAQAPRLVATTATLTVLGGEVEHVPAATTRAGRPEGSVDLAEGDRVRTGSDGRALITFLDGTTVTVEPGSEITVRRARVARGERTDVGVLVGVGTVWARVAGWLGSRGTVSIESHSYTATAHDGLIGGRTLPDGTFVCWTRAGTLRLLRADGRPETALQPGERATAVAGRPAVVESFAVHLSTLEVVVTGPVLPLLVLPDGQRVVGFVEPGVEANQVFGSLTAIRGDRGRIIEVPAGAAGTYRLVLAAVGQGPYEVTVTGRFRTLPVYGGGARGRVNAGDRLVAAITQQVAADGAPDPRTARVTEGRMAAPQPLAEPMPGTVLLSPLELAATSRR